MVTLCVVDRSRWNCSNHLQRWFEAISSQMLIRCKCVCLSKMHTKPLLQVQLRASKQSAEMASKGSIKQKSHFIFYRAIPFSPLREQLHRSVRVKPTRLIKSLCPACYLSCWLNTTLPMITHFAKTIDFDWFDLILPIKTFSYNAKWESPAALTKLLNSSTSLNWEPKGYPCTAK